LAPDTVVTWIPRAYKFCKWLVLIAGASNDKACVKLAAMLPAVTVNRLDLSRDAIKRPITDVSDSHEVHSNAVLPTLLDRE
jgi:hypothetical protein